MPHDHTIPISLHDLLGLLAREGLLVPGTPEAAESQRIVGLLRAECNARGDRLKQLYAEAHAGDDEFWRPGEPDPATMDARNQALIAAMQETLERANYKPIDDRHLAAAMDAEAVFNVQVQVDMQQFRALHLWARGQRPRTETLVGWFGLRKRTITFDVFDRVFVFAKLDPAAAAGAGTGRRGKKAKRRPKELNLKLFRGIPLPDLEMLLPNSHITMRRLDKAAILVPMGVSIVMAASKVLLSLTAIWGAVQFAVGLSKDPPAVSGGWLIVVAGCGTLLGIAMGAYTKYQKRRLEYTSAYTETLYYQTLDSETGAFLRVLDEAFEEEAKEAVLAHVFMRRYGELPLPELDARIEAWLEAMTGRKVDFEVEDGVGKVRRLIAAAAGVGITALLGAATATSPAAAATTATVAPLTPMTAAAAPNHGRCVGMFLDTTSGGGSMYQMLPRQVPADATNLLIIGEIPCRDQVMAWSSRGTYRVFEDGAVQFLASPMPPCPKGDYYVWIEFPR